MSDKVEATDTEREKHSKKDMEEMNKRHGTVNGKLWSCNFLCHAVQTGCTLEKSLTQDKLVVEAGTRGNSVEPQRKKRVSTPITRIDSTMASGGIRSAMKVGVSNSARTIEDSGSPTSAQPNAKTWANTWEMMNRTLEAFATMNTDSSDRGSGKSRKNFKKPTEFKDDSDGCIDT